MKRLDIVVEVTGPVLTCISKKKKKRYSGYIRYLVPHTLKYLEFFKSS